MIGVTKNTIYNYENGGVIPNAKIPILRLVFDNMKADLGLKTEESETSSVSDISSSVHSGRLLKLYDAEASGGFGSFEAMIGENKVVGEFVVPSFSAAEWMIYVKGSSMYPKYSSGDIVACKQLFESKFIQWNKVYVLATKEQGLLIKRLMPSEKDKHLKAVSDNKDYPPFDIPEDEILGLALVLGVIRLE